MNHCMSENVTNILVLKNENIVQFFFVTINLTKYEKGMIVEF